MFQPFEMLFRYLLSELGSLSIDDEWGDDDDRKSFRATFTESRMPVLTGRRPAVIDDGICGVKASTRKRK